MNVGIIGLGYVGLTLSIAAADSGLKVYGVEISNKIKSCLRENKAHFFEPGLDPLIKTHNNKNFFLVERFPSDIVFDAFVITVGTPLEKGATTPDFQYIKNALMSIKDVYTGNELVVLRSTVSVGTTRNIVLPFLSELCNKPEDEILISFCPERTVEGKAIEELSSLPQIISGNNEKSVTIAQNMFREITPYVIKAKSIEEAELIKLYNNTYRDITFAIGNVFNIAAQTFGIDGNSVIRTANQGYSRSNIGLPGFVGGPCLEKDAYILTHNMVPGDSKDFIINARNFNESLEDIVIAWVEKKLKAQRENKVIAISGLAFKGVPNTSDLRGSNSVNIARKLKEKGYTIHLHDFVADREEIRELQLGDCYDDIYSACEKANILLVLNNNGKYANLVENDAILNTKVGFCILDAWNCCRNLYNNDKIDIYNLGNMLIKRGAY